MQNKYPHRKKWLIANLKDKPGKRPLGSSTARRKLTQTSTLIVYCPRPIQGRETQPSQHPAHVRREFNPLASAGAGSGDHPPDTGCRQARASSRLRSQDGISIQGVQENRLQKQPWLLCLLQGPQQLQHKEQQRNGDIYSWVPSRICKHFPTMSSSSSLNTLRICSLQALNQSRLLSLPAGDESASILLKKEMSFQEFT